VDLVFRLDQCLFFQSFSVFLCVVNDTLRFLFRRAYSSFGCLFAIAYTLFEADKSAHTGTKNKSNYT
jgi:hypothetical protein